MVVGELFVLGVIMGLVIWVMMGLVDVLGGGGLESMIGVFMLILGVL